MAKRRSKAASTKKKTHPKSAGLKKKTQGKKAPAKHEIDDIDLLNAHNYPESLPGAIVAKIRNSRESQKRLEELLKFIPSGRRSSKKDITTFLPEKEGESSEEEWDNSDEYEYEYYEEEEETEEPRSQDKSALKRLFGKNK